MAATLRMRKLDLGAALSTTLALQQVNSSTPRAYYIKQALKLAGWTVYYSSDGVTAGGVDTWGTSAFQAVLVQNDVSTYSTTTATVDGIWCCLRSPTADVNGDYLHICLSPRGGSWYDPVARGLSNALTTYGVNAKAPTYYWHKTGNQFGSLMLGMTMSSLTEAFTGGSPFSASTAATARGDLPTAASAVSWTIHNLGACAAANTQKSLTVVTEGNQFHVVTDTAASSAAGSRYWFSVCSMTNGGYCVLEPSVSNVAATSPAVGNGFAGGRIWGDITTPVAPALDVPTALGGWRTGYVKRDTSSGVAIAGGLACPEPSGWEAVVDGLAYSAGSMTAKMVALRAVSATDPDHVDLGTVSDFVMLSNTNVNDLGMLSDSGTSRQWWALKDSLAVMLKWDWLDNPNYRQPLTIS